MGGDIPRRNNIEKLATGGNASKGDDELVRKFMWNSRNKCLVEGLEREISLDVTRLGALR